MKWEGLGLGIRAAIDDSREDNHPVAPLTSVTTGSVVQEVVHVHRVTDHDTIRFLNLCLEILSGFLQLYAVLSERVRWGECRG